MATVAARGLKTPTGRFETLLVQRRDLRPDDILIDIRYAGICHSDLHHARAEWGHTTFPIVPGHEIAGVVTAVGSEVTGFTAGDRAGVGCMVDSCGKCPACQAGQQQYCEVRHVLTYNAVDFEGARTYGGYSEQIVVPEGFAVRIPETISLASAAPMMCAGITLYSPLRHWNAGPGRKVGIVGFGGLGHVGVQVAARLGAETTVFSLGEESRTDALRLGACDYRDTAAVGALDGLAGRFDLIISTVPISYDLNTYLGLLAMNGTLVNLGVPAEPLSVVPHSLLTNRRSLAGSLIGGITETQEMIDFCAENGVGAEVEVIGADGIDEAYDRVSRGDVRYRFVIDISTIATLTPASLDAEVAPL